MTAEELKKDREALQIKEEQCRALEEQCERLKKENQIFEFQLKQMESELVRFYASHQASRSVQGFVSKYGNSVYDSLYFIRQLRLAGFEREL